MTWKIKNIKPKMHKARACKVKPVGNCEYVVTSSTSGEKYLVNTNAFICTCPRQMWITSENDFVNACAHVQAALIFEWLGRGYWLVSRGEEDKTKHLKRKIVRMTKLFSDEPASDGVYFTARVIPQTRAVKHLVKMRSV